MNTSQKRTLKDGINDDSLNEEFLEAYAKLAEQGEYWCKICQKRLSNNTKQRCENAGHPIIQYHQFLIEEAKSSLNEKIQDANLLQNQDKQLEARLQFLNVAQVYITESLQECLQVKNDLPQTPIKKANSHGKSNSNSKISQILSSIEILKKQNQLLSAAADLSSNFFKKVQDYTFMKPVLDFTSNIVNSESLNPRTRKQQQFQQLQQQQQQRQQQRQQQQHRYQREEKREEGDYDDEQEEQQEVQEEEEELDGFDHQNQQFRTQKPHTSYIPKPQYRHSQSLNTNVKRKHPSNIPQESSNESNSITHDVESLKRIKSLKNSDEVNMLQQAECRPRRQKVYLNPYQQQSSPSSSHINQEYYSNNSTGCLKKRGMKLIRYPEANTHATYYVNLIYKQTFEDDPILINYKEEFQKKHLNERSQLQLERFGKPHHREQKDVLEIKRKICSYLRNLEDDPETEEASDDTKQNDGFLRKHFTEKLKKCHEYLGYQEEL